jgi:heat shock protein HspQ
MSVKEHIGDKMRKARADPFYPLVAEDEPAYVPSKGWEEMISTSMRWIPSSALHVEA